MANPDHNQIPAEFARRSTATTDRFAAEQEAKDVARAEKAAIFEREQHALSEQLFKETHDILVEASGKIDALVARTPMGLTQDQLKLVAFRLAAFAHQILQKDEEWDINKLRHYYFDVLVAQSGMSMVEYEKAITFERDKLRDHDSSPGSGKKYKKDDVIPFSGRNFKTLWGYLAITNGWKGGKAPDDEWRAPAMRVLAGRVSRSNAAILELVFFPEGHDTHRR